MSLVTRPLPSFLSLTVLKMGEPVNETKTIMVETLGTSIHSCTFWYEHPVVKLNSPSATIISREVAFQCLLCHITTSEDACQRVSFLCYVDMSALRKVRFFEDHNQLQERTSRRVSNYSIDML